MRLLIHIASITTTQTTTTDPKRRGEVRIPPKIKRATKQVAKILVKSILAKMAFIKLFNIVVAKRLDGITQNAKVTNAGGAL